MTVSAATSFVVIAYARGITGGACDPTLRGEVGRTRWQAQWQAREERA
jgi:hypothetical protein